MSGWRLVAVHGATVDALLRHPDIIAVLQRAPEQPGYELGLGDEPDLARQRWSSIERTKDVFIAGERWLRASCEALRAQRPEDTAIVDLLDLTRPAAGDVAGTPAQRLVSARALRRLTGVVRYADTAAWRSALVAQLPEEEAEVHAKRVTELRRRLERAVVVDQGLWMTAGE